MPVVLDLYDGAYGQTLHLSTEEPEELLEIIEVFRSLASGPLSDLDFAGRVSSTVSGFSGLKLSCVRKTPKKKLVLEVVGRGGKLLYWSGTAEDWQECLEKVEVLADSSEPGHQYLTQEGVDDALVELCYREGRPA